MAKLPHTSLTSIAITFLVMNLSTRLSRVFSVFLWQFFQTTSFFVNFINTSYVLASRTQQKLIFSFVWLFSQFFSCLGMTFSANPIYVQNAPNYSSGWCTGVLSGNFTWSANWFSGEKPYSTSDFTLCANYFAPNPYNFVVQISSYARTHTSFTMSLWLENNFNTVILLVLENLIAVGCLL